MDRTVLVIDSDGEQARRVGDAYQREGWRTQALTELDNALDERARLRPDVVVIALGELTQAQATLALVRQIRDHCDTGIIVHSSRDEETEQLIAFASGADDFVVRPYSLRVLFARSEALLRRRRQAHRAASVGQPTNILTFGAVTLDPDMRQVRVGPQVVHLTRTEYDVLAMLMLNPRRVVSRRELVTQIWGEWHGDDHTIEAHLSRMRTKIIRAGGPRVGEPVSGIGYRLGRHDAVVTEHHHGLPNVGMLA